MRLSRGDWRGTAHGQKRPLRSAKSVFAASALVVGAFAMVPAFGIHGTRTLTGSNFEIDNDANLKVDHASPSIDWASVTENRQADKASGAGDDSFGNGTKEDTPVPSVVDGSIPPNKSDLLNFGVYFEPNTDFMHVFWHRVQEPSGTTNMDFEFNQSEVTSANGVTPVRTEGDMLIQYDLSQGGTNPQLFLSRWIPGSGSTTLCEGSNKLPCWGKRANLTESGDATGSINTAAILAAESDGLGAISPRTFGEATVDLTGLLPEGDECNTFASAYLKSRSSDSFTAALKDFIAPAAVGGDNCGDLTIVKTDPNGVNLAGAKFKVYLDDGDGVAELGTQDTQIGAECTTTSNGTGDCVFDDILIGESVWVHETVVPTGYNVVPPNPKLKLIDEQTESITFVNTPALGALKVVKADDAGNLMNGVTFTLTGTSTIGTNVNLSCTTGVSNSDATVPAQGECTFIDVPVGTEYTLAEGAVPAGYTSDSDFPMLSVDILGAQTVTVNVTNPRQHRVIVLVCHEGTDTLVATDVANGGTTKQSLGPAGLTPTQQAQLCTLGGASFGGLGHGSNTSTATIASH